MEDLLPSCLENQTLLLQLYRTTNDASTLHGFKGEKMAKKALPRLSGFFQTLWTLAYCLQVNYVRSLVCFDEIDSGVVMTQVDFSSWPVGD